MRGGEGTGYECVWAPGLPKRRLSRPKRWRYSKSAKRKEKLTIFVGGKSTQVQTSRPYRSNRFQPGRIDFQNIDFQTLVRLCPDLSVYGTACIFRTSPPDRVPSRHWLDQALFLHQFVRFKVVEPIFEHFRWNEKKIVYNCPFAIAAETVCHDRFE